MNLDLIQTVGNLSSKEFWTEYDLTESPEEQIELIVARGAYDVELFSDTFFSHHCQLPFSRMHNEYFTRARKMERGQKRVTAAPRGYAKSTLEALIKPIHDLCYGLEKYILIISCTETQSIDRLSDIRSELLFNEALNHAYGPFFKSKMVSSKRFVSQCHGREIKYAAYGRGAEMRGVKWGPHRPSKIICDDIEHSTEVENESLRTDQRNWFFEVVSKLGNDDTNICFIGTKLHKDSLLSNLLTNPGYESKVYKAIISWDESPGLWQQWKELYCDLSNPHRMDDAKQFYLKNKQEMLKGTNVLWPEKEDYYTLQCEILESGRRSFYKEKQNDPRSTEAHIFDLSCFEYFSVNSSGDLVMEKDGRILKRENIVGRFGVLDPAHGQNKKPKKGTLGDFACLLTGVVDSYGYLYVIADWTKRLPPTKQIRSIFDHHDVWHYDKFGIESNLFRELMIQDILEEKKNRELKAKGEGKKDYGIKIAWYDIVNTEKKEARIYTLEPKVMNGFVRFNRGLSEEFYNQMEAFPFGDNDDAPDALHMLYNLAHRRYEANAVNLNAMAR